MIIDQHNIKTLVPIPTNGLVGEWLFSNNANDTSGNNNNGTVIGATLVNDRKGNPNSAYSFDGIDDKIEIPNSSSLRNDIYSISLWINLPTLPTTNGHVYGCFTVDSNVNRDFTIRITSTGSVQFINNDENEVISIYESSVLISTGTWYHIVCIHGATEDKIYIGGDQDESADYSSGSFNAGVQKNEVTPYTFGDYDSDDRPIEAIIDDTRQYNRELTDNEITILNNE